MDDYNLEITKGTTYSTTLSLTDGNGDPIDLNDYNLSGFLKFKYSDDNLLLNLNPLKVDPAEEGNIILNVPDTGTATLPVGIGVYDIELYHTGNHTTDKILKGKVYIYPEVTY